MPFVWSQNPYAIKLNKGSGLPGNNVYNVFQDTKHYIWITTNEGLSRYDGIEFITYQSDKQTSYPGSCIAEDKLGRIWYENFDGNLYYVKNDSLHYLQQNKPVGYVPFGITTEHVFVVQTAGVDVYDINDLHLIKTIGLPTTHADHATVCNNEYYLFSDYILYKISNHLQVTNTTTFINKPAKNRLLFKGEKSIFMVSKLNEEKLIYKINNQLKIEDSIIINEPSFIQSVNYIDRFFWLNTPSGTYCYTSEGNLIQHYFETKSISCVQKDYQNNYWFSTTNEGVNIVSQLSTKSIQSFKSKGIPVQISPYKNGYLIATKLGEIVYTDKNFNVEKNILSSQDQSAVYYLFADTFTHEIYYSSNIFGKINPGGNASEKTILAAKDICYVDETYLAHASSGLVGFIKKGNKPSVWDSLFVNNINTGTSKSISVLNSKIRGKTVSYNSKDTCLYFGTNNGLFWYKPNVNGEILFNEQKIFAQKIAVYNNQLFILNTKGNLYLNNLKGNHLLLNHTIGIENNSIKSFTLMGKKLYVYNQKYIYELDLIHRNVKKISPYLGSIDITDFTVSNNSLIILSGEGIIDLAINTSRTKNTPQFYINSVRGRHNKESSNNVFKYNQNDITIRFSILEYGEKNYENLYYTVNNDDPKLIAENSNKVELPSLSPGNYTINFYIDSKKIDQTVEFTILRPVWKRWWFVCICILFAFFTIYSYYKYQTGLLRRQVKLLNEKVQLENKLSKSILKSVKSQMNPHFFYNALNTIQAFIFTNNKEKANGYLAKFSKLTRLILEQSEQETITLNEEIQTIQLYLELEKMRFSTDFEYTIQVQNNINKDEIEFPPMLIQPYIENAIKHGLLHKESEKVLTIHFELSNMHLIVTIDDNGIGRKKAEELNKIKEGKYASFSSQANEKRLEILNKVSGGSLGIQIIDKTDNEKRPTGTTVIITIPIK